MLFKQGRTRRIRSSALSSNYIKSRNGQLLVAVVVLAVIGAATAVAVMALGRE